MTPAATRERLSSLVSAFAGRRLLVVGDFVLDRFVYGHPKRVSREAPVVILRFVREENLPGGAGNAAANVRALGGEAAVAGALGDDEPGRTLRRLLEERGIATDGLVEAAGYATPTKTRIVGGAPHAIKQQIVRFDREERLPDGGITASIARAAARLGAGAAAAVLSDYGYGALTPAIVTPLRTALPRSAPILLDSRHELPSYRGVDAVTPNEEELEECGGRALGDSDEALDRAATDLAGRVGCRTVLVTRGSRGIALYDAGERPVRIPVHGTDQVADTTGAGDTVLGTFALALASGATPHEAALLANFAGGIVVMKTGTAVVTANELRNAIASDRTILS